MELLCLDPAISTGYCLVTINDSKTQANIHEYGYIDTDSSLEFIGDQCLQLMKSIENLIDQHKVNHIAIEDYFFSKRFANGCNVNAAYRTAIHILARQKSIEYTILNITSWKNYVAGRSKPTKEMCKTWGKEASKKIMIQDALWKTYGFKFPNHSISKTTGNPIKFRNDIVDSVGQAVYFCGLLKRVPEIKMSVACPPDVVLKIKNKGYDYPPARTPLLKTQ